MTFMTTWTTANVGETQTTGRKVSAEGGDPARDSKFQNHQLHTRTPEACLGAIATEVIDAAFRELGGRVRAMPRATVPMQKEALK